jgi:hypothetical protein
MDGGSCHRRRPDRADARQSTGVARHPALIIDRHPGDLQTRALGVQARTLKSSPPGHHDQALRWQRTGCRLVGAKCAARKSRWRHWTRSESYPLSNPGPRRQRTAFGRRPAEIGDDSVEYELIGLERNPSGSAALKQADCSIRKSQRRVAAATAPTARCAISTTSHFRARRRTCILCRRYPATD